MRKVEFKQEINYDKPGVYTFLSTLNFRKFYESNNSAEISIIPDGITMISLLFIKYRRVFKKNNFDLSGLAPIVISTKKNNIYFFGGDKNEIKTFKNYMFKLFKSINEKNSFFYNGFDELEKINTIKFQKNDIIILSIGCPLQERIGANIFLKNNFIRVFTSGAFISQTAKSNNTGVYYPKLIEKLNLRFIYRALKEKGHYKRLVSAFIDFIYIIRRI